jgi:hypothetical protein
MNCIECCPIRRMIKEKWKKINGYKRITIVHKDSDNRTYVEVRND